MNPDKEKHFNNLKTQLFDFFEKLDCESHKTEDALVMTIANNRKYVQIYLYDDDDAVLLTFDRSVDEEAHVEYVDLRDSSISNRAANFLFF